MSAEPEATAEAEVLGTAEAEPEVVAEVIAEPLSTAEAVAEVISSAEPEVVAQAERPSVQAILLPPFGLLIIIIGALVAVWALTQYRKHQSKKETEEDPSFTYVEDKKPKRTLLTEEDDKILDAMQSHYNKPLQLMMVGGPAILSLAACPAVLFMYEPLVKVMWPSGVAPDINDAIAVFLAPAGLVYAISFGFVLQHALQKQATILFDVSSEMCQLDQIVTIVSHMNIHLSLKKKVYRLVKDEIIATLLQIQGVIECAATHYRGRRVIGQVWYVLDVLKDRSVVTNNHMNEMCTTNIGRIILQYHHSTTELVGLLKTRIHPLLWFILELLGFFSFFGVLMLKAQSASFELLACIITVFSITMLCYVVSDLDNPFNGVFRVNLSSMSNMIEKMVFLYDLTENGDDPKLPYLGDEDHPSILDLRYELPMPRPPIIESATPGHKTVLQMRRKSQDGSMGSVQAFFN